MFVDERTIIVCGGSGGNGIVHWRREKYVAKGGPDGGNGGNGGSVYLHAVRSITALNTYHSMERKVAKNGGAGGGILKHGKNAEDLLLSVPIGSIIENLDTNERFELLEEGATALVASGGEGGLGNAHFKSSTNTTPTTATPGTVGQEYTLRIHLHLIADVGIIGLPSAGKTTLLNEFTRAHAKIGDYPFTTLEPNLGSFHGFMLADIPGLIEGASLGKGLGHRFLKHITRTRMIVHLVSAEHDDVCAAYHTIRKELELFEPTLAEKMEVVVLSKIDLVTKETLLKQRAALIDCLAGDGKQEIFGISIIDDVSMKNFAAILSRELNSL